MDIITPCKQHYNELANIFNIAILPFIEIYSDEEKACFCLKEGAFSMQKIHKKNKIIAIQDNNAIIGYLAYHTKNEHCIWINSLYVLPTFQRKGFGKRLLSKLEIVAKKNNISIIALETHRLAFWAINFYTKQGYSSIITQISKHPYNKVLNNPPIPNRPLLGKIIN